MQMPRALRPHQRFTTIQCVVIFVQVLLGAQSYFVREATSRDVARACVRAVAHGHCGQRRNPFLYQYAVHTVATFIFAQVRRSPKLATHGARSSSARCEVYVVWFGFETARTSAQHSCRHGNVWKTHTWLARAYTFHYNRALVLNQHRFFGHDGLNWAGLPAGHCPRSHWYVGAPTRHKTAGVKTKMSGYQQCLLRCENTVVPMWALPALMNLPLFLVTWKWIDFWSVFYAIFYEFVGPLMSLVLLFFRWDISVIFCWEILVTETFRSFVSQMY